MNSVLLKIATVAAVLQAVQTHATAQGEPTGQGETPAAALSLAGTKWILQDIEQRGVHGAVQSTLEFDGEGRASGQGGCNRFWGAYTEDGSALTFSPMASTRMACPSPSIDQEARDFTALQRVQRWEIDTGGQLLLHGMESMPLLAFTRLGTAK